MARFRIVRRPSVMVLNCWVYDIQRRYFFWWKTVSSSWLSLESAEAGLIGLKETEKMDLRPKVIKEYD